MAVGESNLDTLYNAGVLLTKELSKKELEIIKSLSKSEIETLIRLKEKVGSNFVREVKGEICSRVI